MTCERGDEGWRWASEELEDVGVEFVFEDVSKGRPVGSGGGGRRGREREMSSTIEEESEG